MSHRVELEIFECVTQGGVRRVTWHISSDEHWISATQAQGAEIVNVDSARGVVWRRRVNLELTTGARLMRVESQPDRAVAKDPMAYLWQGRRGVGRKVNRDYFRVGADGKLVRDSAPHSV